MESSLRDRRRYPRAVLDWPVTISLSEGAFPARLRDISSAGMCFYLDRRVPEMTVLAMDLELPPRAGVAEVARVRGSGVVVRCQPVAKLVDHYEIAVFLNQLGDDARAVIERYVARAQA